MTSARILASAIDAIAAHAVAEAPLECCGFLVGTDDVIDEVVTTRNILASPTRYQVDPREHLTLMKQLRGSPRSIRGAYHSHPASPPIPSETDLAEAHYPEFLYVIVSLVDGQTMRAYRIAKGVCEGVRLETVD